MVAEKDKEGDNVSAAGAEHRRERAEESVNFGKDLFDFFYLF